MAHRNHFNASFVNKKIMTDESFNDASVNAFIRLYLRVMIIAQQERNNKNRRQKRGLKERVFFVGTNEIVGV